MTVFGGLSRGRWSGKDVPNDSRFFDAGEALIEALERKNKLLVVESDGMEKGCVKVADADFVHGCFISDFVSLTVVGSAFDSAASHPQGECVRVGVSAGLLPFL